MDFGTTIGTEATHSSEPEFTGGLPPITTPNTPSPSRPLSASSRTLIRKHFTESCPILLPMGNATLAFNEHQVHSVLLAVSDESVRTSFHLMKNLLEETMRIGARFRDGPPGPSRQRAYCLRRRSQLGTEAILRTAPGGTPVEL